jgi:hypothetical protein
MALRLNGTDPFLRASIGAFSGYAIRQSPLSMATCLKRIGASSWQGLHIIDQGSTSNFFYSAEFNPSNQMIGDTDPGHSAFNTTATFNDTTNWMIVGFCWDGSGTAGHWVWRWKIGAGAWSSETATSDAPGVATIGAGYRHLIGNEAALGDDANYDWVCTGLIKSNLAQATFESLTLTDIASWDAVFTGAGAWLLDGQALASRTDRTGNGGNESSRSGSITLVSDPPGWSWGGAVATIPPRSRRSVPRLYLPSGGRFAR